MPRTSSKDKYTKQVFELFKEKGLMHNMDQIAQELGLTKKTLYNNFASKQELIVTAMKYFYSELDKKIKVSSQKSSNAIEAFVDISYVINTEICNLGTLLLRDVSLNPSTSVIFSFTDRKNFFSKLVMENLKRGMEEGVYRKNLDTEYTTLFFTAAIDLFYRWNDGFKYMNETSNFHRQLVKHHLYSVVNEKGMTILESYLFNRND